MNERRRFRRYSVALDARYTKVQGCTSVSSLCTTQNVSMGGLRTTLSRLIEKGDELLVELMSPSDNRRIATLAKVVWVKESGRVPYNLCGMQFLWLSSESFLEGCFKLAKEDPVI